MQREALQSRLEEGLSLEQIGRLVGKHPSTVAYWVRKHGLRSGFAGRHAPRGGIAREVLAALVVEGRSSRGIAVELGVSQATVRHWLAKHGLKTRRSARQAEKAASLAPGADGSGSVGTCPRHGTVGFVRQASETGYRCVECRKERVAARRRAIKRILVEEAGGACRLCGYDAYLGALQFHHLDPAVKEFGLGLRGVARSLERCRAEARKCVLLCANCHAEVEAGVATLSAAPADHPG